MVKAVLRDAAAFLGSTRACAGLLLALSAGAAVAGDRQLPVAGLQEAAPIDRLLLKAEDLDAPGVRRLLALADLTSLSGLPGMRLLRQMHDGTWVITLSRPMPPADAPGLQRLLSGLAGRVLALEPDVRVRALATPNDPLFSQQWNYYDATGGIRLPQAHDVSLGRGVTVAVIDNGVRAHADLAANMVPGYDFIGDTRTANDGNGRDGDASDPGDGTPAGFCTGDPLSRASVWHGTHVAGTVAALTGNGLGVAGVAPQARILPVRVLGRCGGYLSDVADGVVWSSGGSVPGVPANERPARVLNLSLGGGGTCPSSMQSAINAANSRGSVVVVAAGNDGASASGSVPANCSGVVVVAATGITGAKASYSNTGQAVTLAAPGGDGSAGILSTYNAGSQAPSSDNYETLQGTSMATPHVAGVAALMLSVNPGMSAAQVRQTLVSTARPFPGNCSGCGAGILDARAAVVAASGGSSVTPTEPAPTPTPAPAPVVTAVTEIEPNNSLTASQVLASNSVNVSGSLVSGDVDFYALNVPAGVTVTASLGSAAGTNFDLAAFDAQGRLLASSTRGAGQVDVVSIRNGSTVSTRAHLRVSRGAVFLFQSPNGAYSLEVRR